MLKTKTKTETEFKIENSLPDVIVANLNPYFTGVTATLENLYPLQAREVSLGLHGYNLSFATKKVSFRELLWHARHAPADKPFRIYHARRAVDLRRGLFLRDFCRAKIKVLFTSVKQSRHSFPLRRMISRCDGVIALTEQAARLCPHVRAVIPHGVDTRRFAPVLKENWEAYAQSRNLGGKRAVGQIGNIRRSKGSDVFVRALCRVLPFFPDVVGVVAGRWLVKDAPLRWRLQKMTHEAGIADRVLWLGQTSYDAIPSLLRSLDLYVSCSLKEGFSMAALEALSCGTPLLLSRCGGAEQVVAEGETGYIVPCGDEEALAERLYRFLALKDGKARMTHACRSRAEKFFGIEREAAAIVSVYKNLWRKACGETCGERGGRHA